MSQSMLSNKTGCGKSGVPSLDSICRTVSERGSDPLVITSTAISRYLSKMGVSLDPNRTVSEQANEARLRGEQWGIVVCKALDLVDPGHCAKQPVYGPVPPGSTVSTQPSAGSAGGDPRCKWGLNTATYNALQMFGKHSLTMGLPDPREHIISGYRSPEKQLMMRQAWDAGNRAGLAARPALPQNSRHCRREAFDLSGRPAQLKAWGRLWKILGHRWGGSFYPNTDPNHFDLG